MVILKGFYADAQIRHPERFDSFKVFLRQVIGMAFHVNLALHVECPIDVIQDFIEASVKHCGWRSAADIKSRNGFHTEQF